MPPRIPDDKRAAILADIKERKASCRALAKTHGVSTALIRSIAAEAGITDAFSRENVEKATRAIVADNRSRRAALASALLDDADKLRARAWESYSYYERGQLGPELVTLDKPPLRDAKEAYVALGIALDKHVVLERHDATDPGTMGSLLGTLLAGLQAKHGTGDA